MLNRFFSGVVLRRFIVFGTVIVSFQVTFRPHAQEPIEEKIKEAAALLDFKPSQSLEIIESIEKELLHAEPNLRLKAYINGIWAGQNRASVVIVRKYTDLLVSMAGEDAILDEVPRIASALATQFWRMGEYTMAKQFAFRSLYHTDKKRITHHLQIL